LETYDIDYTRYAVVAFSEANRLGTPIVKLPRKPPRYRYRTVNLDKSKKKGF
jgi:hypothetical protein